MPSSQLLDHLRRVTPSHIQTRGINYFRGGRVGAIRQQGVEYHAPVKGLGGQVYSVRIAMPTARDGETQLSCSCPYFEQFTCCKHVFALGLAIEALPDSESARPTGWRELLTPRALPAERLRPPSPSRSAPAPGHVHFLIDPGDTDASRPVRLHVLKEKILKSGRRRLESIPILEAAGNSLPAEELIQIVQLQRLLLEQSTFSYYSARASSVHLPADLLFDTLSRLLDSGRLWLGDPANPPLPETDRPLLNGLAEDWRLTLEGERGGPGLRLRASLRSGERRLALDGIAFFHPAGIFSENGVLRKLVNPDWLHWALRIHRGEIHVPESDIPEFVERILQLPSPPPLALPGDLAFREICSPPAKRLRIGEWSEAGDARVRPAFAYPTREVDWLESADRFIHVPGREIHLRDFAAESIALKRLEALGAHLADAAGDGWLSLRREVCAGTLSTLEQEGWELWMRDSRVRSQHHASLNIRQTDRDWFELDGTLDFGGAVLPLPEVLRQVKLNGNFIRLPGGATGLLSGELSQKLQILLGISTEQAEGGGYRFGPAGLMMADRVLEAMPGVDWDQRSLEIRNRLRSLGSPKPVPPPPGFRGELRPYQQEGLGWMRYLRETGLNGCLADDMGLGKTVQVLALLEEQRAGARGPSLAVLPRSIVFNWRKEAERFTPALRVVHLGGNARPRSAGDLPPADLYLITYQTLLRDVAWLADLEFDYVILDESQAIKNAAAKTSRAVRRLRSRHRLALTGTPVENRVEDLWSQLDFLNPGMPGRRLLEARDLSAESLDLISRAVRPFLLRRTKEEVAPDLPEKFEETLFCELPPAQRKLYQQLKKYYQQALAEGIAQTGFAKSKIKVLEALLRLRQAACHPGLISEGHANMESGKLGALEELLEDILSSGHKALIFSQFTSMLALVRKRLDERGTGYAYLDGQSRDRELQVARFQNDPALPLFLISLKAGGVGLNLTAADYVILLDPWWNPAIEAQAVDRAHRIGQEKNVFAYRIVARDTVEEKILALQAEKRELANAILTGENRMLSGLTPEDLDFLLS